MQPASFFIWAEIARVCEGWAEMRQVCWCGMGGVDGFHPTPDCNMFPRAQIHAGRKGASVGMFFFRLAGRNTSLEFNSFFYNTLLLLAPRLMPLVDCDNNTQPLQVWKEEVMAKNTTKRTAEMPSGDGLIRLHALVVEARQYHDASPHSKRKSLRGDSMEVSTGSDNSEASQLAAVVVTTSDTPLDPWDYLGVGVDHFWNSDPDDESSKYQRGKAWLTSMYLWDLDRTWQECDANSQAHVQEALAQRRRDRLASLPRGKLFHN